MRRLEVVILMIVLPTLVFSAMMEFSPPTDDVYIYSGNTGNNFNSNDYLCHGYDGVGGHIGYFYTLVRWNISGLPSDITIDSATMELYCFEVEGSPNGTPYYYIVIEDWDEGTVTWDSAPDFDSNIQTSSSWPDAGSWHYIDVTEFVQNWYNGSYTNYGIYGVTQGTSDNGYPKYHSKEYSGSGYHPKLTVEFTYNEIQSTSLGQIKSLFE